MKFLLDIRTILFVIPGALLQVTHLALFREMTATCGSPLLIAAVLMIVMFSSMAIGVILPVDGITRRYGRAKTLWVLSLLLSTSTILVTVAIPLATTTAIEVSLSWLIMIAVIATLPLGLTSGVLLKFIYQLTPGLVSKNALGFLGFGYLFAGVNLDSGMLLESMHPLIFGLGMLLVVCSAVALRYHRKNITTLAVAAISGCVLISNIFLLQETDTARDKYWRHREPDRIRVQEFNSRVGRTTLLRDTVSGSLLVCKNGAPTFIMPDDSSKHTQSILPAILQPHKQQLKVLTVCSPFSMVPGILTSLAPVEHLVLPVSHRGLAALADTYRILPGNALNLKLVFAEPVFYLKTTKEQFDLVLLLENDNAYCSFETLIALIKPRLTAGGAVVIAAGMLMTGNNFDYLDKLFEKSVLLPGGGGLHAFGEQNVTANIDKLEERFTKAFPDNQNNPLPRGVFSVLYSTPSGATNHILPSRKEFDIPGINLPRENMAIKFRLLLVAIVFLALRFIFCRRSNFGSLWGLFENGICTTGIMLLLTTIIYHQGLSFFVEDKTVIAAFGCIGIGFALSGISVLKRICPFLALITVVFIFSCQWDAFFYAIPAIVGMDCLSSGLVAGYFSDTQPTPLRKFFFPLYFAGCAIGALLFLTLPDVPNNFYIALAAITLLRLPLFFSKLIVGKTT